MYTQKQSIVTKLIELPMGSQVRDFLNYLTTEAGLSNNTILAYGRDLMGFLEHCKMKSTKHAADIEPAIIQEYQRKLSKASMSESSIKRSLVSIRMFLRFAKLTGLTDEDYTGILEAPKIWQKLPTVCSKKQMLDLLDAPNEKEPFYLRDKMILELLYATGMRASELANLELREINIDIGYIRCYGKGRKERIIPIGKPARAVIIEYLEKLRPELCNQFSGDNLVLSRTGRPAGRIEIWRLVKKYARRAGMPKGLTVHTLRHCFATHMLAGGGPI